MIMKTNYIVSAIPKKPGIKERQYTEVYDIGHYYARNAGKQNHEVLRLLIYNGDKPPERQDINLNDYDVMIHLNK